MACTDTPTNVPPTGMANPANTNQGGGYVRVETCGTPNFWSSDVNANCHFIFNLAGINCVPFSHFLQNPFQGDVDANGFNITNVGKIFIGSRTDDGSGALLQVHGEINADSYMVKGTEFAVSPVSGQVSLINITNINGKPIPSPSAPDGAVQFYDAGGFGGNGSFVFSKLTESLRVGIAAAQTPVWRLDVGGDIDINDSGFLGYAYRINGIPFALLNANRTHIDLVNIGNINGAPPGTGGGGGSAPGGVTGDVQFNSAGLFAGSANLFWDSTNNRLGIGMNVPMQPLDVIGNVNSSGCFMTGGQPFACPSTTAGKTDLNNIATINGHPIGQLLQTPWLSNIDGATFQLTNAGAVLIGTNLFRNFALEVQGIGGPPTTTGNASAAGFTRFGGYHGPGLGTGNMLDIGGYNTSPYACWIRVTDSFNLALNYPLALQPVGGNVGVGNSAPNFPLDVAGSVNSTGCYLIGGLQFACSSGSGGVNLTNITNINGQPPATGTGTPQTPWASNIDGASHNLTNPNLIAVGNNGTIQGDTQPAANKIILGPNASGGAAWGILNLIANRNTTNQAMGQINFCNLAATGQTGTGDFVLASVTSACDGDPNAGLLQFNTRASGTGGVAPRVQITNGGFVGINQFPPAYRLDVLGVAQVVARFNGSSVNGTQVLLNGTTGTGEFIQFQDGGATKWYAGNSGARSNQFMLTADGTNSLFVVTQSGFVGVGMPTAVPASRLDVRAGDINLTGGCYLINAVPFACQNGGGISLSNIVNINGAPVQGPTPPAPPANSIQFNAGGIFGGSPNLYWATNTLVVVGAATIGNTNADQALNIAYGGGVQGSIGYLSTGGFIFRSSSGGELFRTNEAGDLAVFRDTYTGGRLFALSALFGPVATFSVPELFCTNDQDPSSGQAAETITFFFRNSDQSLVVSFKNAVGTVKQAAIQLN